MTTSLTIPIHSVIDVITNSSSEIFVAADKSTITAIRKLVDNIIGAASNGEGIGATADDLFTFDVVYCCTDGEYEEVYLTKAETKAKRKEIEEITDDQTGKYTAEQIEVAEAWEFNDEDGGGSSVRVAVKDKTNKSAVAAAKALSDLTSIFQIEATFN